MNDNSPLATRFFYTALAATLFAYGVVVVDAYSRLSLASDRAGVRSEMVRPSSPARPEDTANRPWQQKVHPFLAGALALIVVRLAYLGWYVGGRRFVIPVGVLVLLLLLVLRDLPAPALRAQLWTQLMQVIGAISILAVLWWLVLREQRFWRSIVVESDQSYALRLRVLLATALIVAATVLGSWSSVNVVGLPCAEFPTCQGFWWPPMDLIDAFSFSRLSDVAGVGAGLTASVATAMHMTHRLIGLIALLYAGWLAMRVFWNGAEHNLCRYGLMVLTLLVCEVGLGIMTVVMGLPTIMLLAHAMVAALLLLSMITLYHVTLPRYR
jgi:cytochrome c oxidase assembly protein subunit 15